MSVNLYEFQADAVERLRENIRRGIKNQILCAPTGAGKTECALHLIAECFERGKRAVFVTDRISLLDQTSARMDRYSVPHGVIQANHWRWRPWDRIQVASIQTMARRRWPVADLIVVDEAHGIHQAVVKKIDTREAVTIGLTATPFTKGLGKHYDAMVSVATTRDLIAKGFLSPFRIFAASEPDMTGAKVVAGEWTEDEAARRSMPIVGDCVAEYLKHGEGQKFIAFGCNVAHCEELQRQFLSAGIQAALYTYMTGDEERRAMVEEFRKPDSYIRGLISVAALSRGFDVESVGVVILARPLRKGFSEHIQMFGRGIRKDHENPSKVCTILDHAGNCLRFWDRMNAFFECGPDVLDDGKRKPKKKPEEAAGRPPKKCPACHHVHSLRPSCPMCGYEYPRRSGIEVVSGELVGIGGGASSTAEQRQAVYSQLLWVATDRGYKPGWAAYQFKARFGVFPQGLNSITAIPTPELLRWVRSQMIRHAKSKKKSA